MICGMWLLTRFYFFLPNELTIVLFNVCLQQRSKGILLGVVGTDVPVKELLKTIPKYKVLHHLFNSQGPNVQGKLSWTLQPAIVMIKTQSKEAVLPFCSLSGML